MKPEHERATKIALSAVGDRGFALAGGNALSEHGIGNRQSDDVDLFTDRMDDNVATTVERLKGAFEEQGYSAEIIRSNPDHARIEVTQGEDKVQYAKYGLSPEETAGVKARMTGWANEIRSREANPDVDRGMRLMQTSRTTPGQGRTAGTTGEAAARHSPYEQGRGMGERGS